MREPDTDPGHTQCARSQPSPLTLTRAHSRASTHSHSHTYTHTAMLTHTVVLAHPQPGLPRAGRVCRPGCKQGPAHVQLRAVTVSGTLADDTWKVGPRPILPR